MNEVELFNEPGEAHALIDVDCERIEVELLPRHHEADDRVWLSVSQSADEECVHTARLTPDQSIRLGHWLVAAGEAALGD